MTSIIKLQKKGQLTIPNQMRGSMGLADGDYVQVVMSGNTITIKPAQVVTRPAAEEYTPAQRRALDSRLAEGLADVKAGRVSGPFDTVEEMAASFRENAKKLKKETKIITRSR